MVKTLKVMLIAVLALYSGLCWAGEKTADPRSVEKLMVKSGLSKQLEQIAPMVQTGMAQQNQQSGSLTAAELNDLNNVAAKAFDAKTLTENVRKHIQANLSEADIQAALTWLNSPLGEKITKLEEDASTPAAYAEMEKMGDKLGGNAGRIDLVKKLDLAVKGTETGVALALNTQTALVAAMTSGMPQEKRPTMEAIEKELNKSRGQIQSAIEQSTLMSFLYAYRNLSDAEINKYIDFANSASGKKYSAVTSDAITAAVTNAAHVMGSMIAQNANKKASSAAGKQHI